MIRVAITVVSLVASGAYYIYKSRRQRNNHEREYQYSYRESQRTARDGDHNTSDHEYEHRERQMPRNSTSGFNKKTLRKRREAVYDKIDKEELDCMICSRRILNETNVVFCQECSEALHYECYTKYTNTKHVKSLANFDGNCPACKKRTLLYRMPSCMCGTPTTRWIRSEDRQPYTCGRNCSRCDIELCHPGPCWRDLPLH